MMKLTANFTVVCVYVCVCVCVVQNSEMFETYKNLCCKAFLILRKNADLIINLFSLVSRFPATI